MSERTSSPSRNEGARSRAGAFLGRFGLPAILAFAAALRLFRLGAESLWFDETYSVSFSSADLRLLSPLSPGGFAFTDKNTYHLLLHFWLALGRSEFTIRLLSALIGVATVGLLYLLAQRLFGRRMGLWAAALLAVSPYHIWYSREARMYGLAALFALAAVLLLYEAVRRGGAVRWAGYAALAALGLYTHTFAMFLVVAGNLWVLVSLVLERRRPWAWLAANLAVGVAAIPWLTQIAAQQGQGWWAWIADKYGTPTLNALLLAPRELAFGAIRVGPSAVYWIGFAAWAGALLLGVLWLRFRRLNWWHSGGNRWALTVILAAAPILLAFAASQARPMFVMRYMVPFAAPMYLLAAWGLASLRRVPLQAILGGVVLAVSLFALVGIYAGGHKEDWRSAGAYLQAQAQPGETVFVVDEDSLVPIRYYSASAADLHWQPVWRGRTDAGELAAIVDPAIANGARFWLVVSHCDTHALETMLSEHRPVAAEHDFLGIRLLRFDVAGGGG